MWPKIQWFLRLAGFITIGVSIFISDNFKEVGALGGLMFLLGMIKFKIKK
ncbi:MAG: hypothetical protein H0Z40_07530 [Desulfotomaculum sp.]|nr:hypothetical protein [Desulfotomaculum sp.]